MQTVIGTMPLH